MPWIPNTQISAAGGVEELAYEELISDVTIVSTTEATPTSIISAGAVVFDGSTRVCIEFYASRLDMASGGGNFNVLNLWDDTTTDLGRVALGLGAIRIPIFTRNFLTPSAGSHTYRIRGFGSAANGVIIAGIGGAGVAMPAYIRITTA